MGHYRQWLHYRGIDQLLRSQLAVTEHEVKQLQVQVDMLGKQDFSPANTIFRALIKKLHQEQYAQWEPIPEQASTKAVKEQDSTLPPVKTVEETISIISPALLAWSQLPNFDTQVIQSPEAHSPAYKQALPPPIPDPSPTDISTSVDAPTPPDAQTKTPWWLHNIDPASQELLATHPGTQQSVHIDYVVQRWFERWGKQSMDAKKSQEDQRE